MPKPKIENGFESDILVEEEQKNFLLRFLTKKYDFTRVYYSWCSIDDRIDNLHSKFSNVLNSPSNVLFII